LQAAEQELRAARAASEDRTLALRKASAHVEQLEIAQKLAQERLESASRATKEARESLQRLSSEAAASERSLTEAKAAVEKARQTLQDERRG
jgi:hypothetical protein